MEVFSVVLKRKGKPWKRKEQAKAGHWYMPNDLRRYYEEIYTELLMADIPVLPGDHEFQIHLTFTFTDYRWRDTDNLLKGTLDAGQPRKWSKWSKDKNFRLMPNLWDDKVFNGVQALRIRGADEDKIRMNIHTSEDVGKLRMARELIGVQRWT